MSTPTSRPPQDEPVPGDGLTAADRAAMGQHAAPRATPPPPPPPPAAQTAAQPTVPPAGGQHTGQHAPPPPAAQSPGPQPASAPAAPPVAADDRSAPTGPAAPLAPGGPVGTGDATDRPAPRHDDVRHDDPRRDDTTARRRDRAAADDTSDRELPEPPKKPGVGRHLIGILLGLALTPVALLMVGIGTARLADVAGTSDMGTDTLGLTLLVVGLVLLAVVVLLGAWTAAVPLTGGLVWGIGLGLAYLVVPGVMEDAAEQVVGSEAPAAVDQLARSAMSGQLVLIGVLLVAAGIAASAARRAGRRYASGVAAAEAARAEATIGERDRIRHEADQRARGRTTG